MPTRRKVLMVDDDPAWVELMEDLLRDEGYTVATAEDGSSALEAISHFEPFVVVTDLRMPGMDGMQLVARVHAQDHRVPVIVLSGQRSLVSQSLPEAFRVLGKFATLEAILAAVSEAAAHRASRLPLQRLWSTATAYSAREAEDEAPMPAFDRTSAPMAHFSRRLLAAVSWARGEPLALWAVLAVFVVSSAVLVRHLSKVNFKTGFIRSSFEGRFTRRSGKRRRPARIRLAGRATGVLRARAV